MSDQSSISSSNCSNSSDSHSSSSNYNNYIKIATENNLSMVLELDLLGNIKYISIPQWESLLGVPSPSIGQPISTFVMGSVQDKSVFQNAVEMMLENDNISYTVTFNTLNKNQDLQLLEACGILIRDNKTNEPTYSMWNVKPYNKKWHQNLVDSLLPDDFIKKLGFGSTIFADYLKIIETENILIDSNLPLPTMELCRVCENFVPAWWLETHSQNCVIEHRIESTVQLIHDNLVDQELIIDNYLETLENQENQENINIQYKDTNIIANSTNMLINLLELLKELTEFTININTSEPITTSNNEINFQFSLNTKANFQYIENWEHSFHLNNFTNDTNPNTGLAMLINDTIELSRKKVDNILRLDNAMKYSQRIKDEVNKIVMQLIRDQIENNRINKAHSLSYQFTNNNLSAHSSITSTPNANYVSMDSLLNDIRHTTNNSQDTETTHRLYPVVSNHLGSGITFTDHSNNNNNSIHTVDEKQHDMPLLVTPQPKYASNNGLFSNSYLKSDELPEMMTNKIHYNMDDNSNVSNTDNPHTSIIYHQDSSSQLIDRNPKASSRSRSITPGTQIDYDIYQSESLNEQIADNSNSNNTSCTGSNPATNPSFYTPQLLSIKTNNNPIQSNLNLNHPKLSTTISLTPRRGSPLPSNLNTYNNQKPGTSNMINDAQLHYYNNSIHSNTASSSNNLSSRLNLEKSPINSPFAMARDYLTPEQYGNALTSPNQPLSPLLLATNQSKNSAPSIRDYDIIKPISKGAYGSVYLARKKLTGDYFAIKALRKSDMIAKNQVMNVKSERAIMMFQNDKPYVAKLFATFQNKDNLFLVMEYLPGGDLATLIKMMDYLPDQWVKQYLTEIIVGVEDMHQNGIIHHDLKPDNLLIDTNGHIKLNDFGLSRAGLVRRHKNGGMSKNVSSNASTEQVTYNSSQSFIPESTNKLNASTKSKKSSTIPLNHNDSDYLNTPSPSVDNSIKHELINIPKSDSQLSLALFEASRSSTPPLQNAPLYSTPSRLKVNSFSSNDSTEAGIQGPSNAKKVTHNTSISTISSVTSNSSDLVLFHPDDSKQKKKFFGTPDYLAPETIEGTGEGDECDWWSLGCVMFELLLGYPPFHADTPEAVFRNILEGNIQWPLFDSPEEEREFLSDDAKDLIKKLLIIDSSKRLGVNGAQEIKDHQYFKGVDWANVYDEEPSFVPSIENLENTEYFDPRGAVLENLDDSDDESSDRRTSYPINDNSDIPALDTGSGFTLNNVKGTATCSTPRKWSDSSTNINGDIYSPVNKLSISSVLESVGNLGNTQLQESSSRNSSVPKSMSLAIPPHMRERRASKLSDSQTEFGSFYFRNLSALDKANKDVINRLKNEHLSDWPSAHRRSSSGSMNGSSPDNSIGKPKLNKISTTGSPALNPTLKNMIRSDSSSIRSFSPDKSIGFDQTSSNMSRKGSIISNIEINTPTSSNVVNNSNKSPNALFFNDSDSPTMTKFKSPLLPASNTFSKTNRNRLFAKSTSNPQHGTVVDILSDETDRLQAVARVNSLRYRRRSSRKSSSTTNNGEIGYHMDILLCEPIPIHRYRATKDLESMGCTVVLASAGDELVRKATSGIKFDLILTPLKLANFNVLDVVKLIRHTNDVNSATPIIAITNYFQEAMSSNMFDDVLEKPINSTQLRRILSKYSLKKSQEESEDTIISDSDDISLNNTH